MRIDREHQLARSKILQREPLLYVRGARHILDSHKISAYRMLICSLCRILDVLKGIVSRDWGGLQMILLDRLEVFNISAAGFFLFCCRFYTVILKMAA